MAVINLENYRFKKEKQNSELKLLPGKKIYHSNRYIYLDKSEFEIVWHNVALFIFLHIYWFRGLYGVITLDPEFILCAPIAMIWSLISGIGVTAGVHRLWAHRTYKAELPLRIFLMFGHIVAGQNNIFIWSRDHRVHHKYSDTDGDPHNTNRGFFFAHMGWLMHKKHPDVIVNGNKIDMSDLKNDPLIKFQIKYYYLLFFILSFALPIHLSMYCFGATFNGAFKYAFMLRYATVLHSTWFVNSAAHMFGTKPYNGKIRPVENLFVAFFTVGEGYHNYHHTFPFDYGVGEFTEMNLGKRFIDFMAKYKLAYDLKRASKVMVDCLRTKETVSHKADENNNYDIINSLNNNCEYNNYSKDNNSQQLFNNLKDDSKRETKSFVINDDQLKKRIEEIKDKKLNNVLEHDFNNISNKILNKINNNEQKER